MPSDCCGIGDAEAVVCDRLAELADGLRRWAAGFDASLLSVELAGVAVTEAAAIEAMAAVVKALAAARVADAGVWKAAGERSAAHHLARSTGTSVSGAGGCWTRPGGWVRYRWWPPRPGRAGCRRPRWRRWPMRLPPIRLRKNGWWSRPGGRRWPSCGTSVAGPRRRPIP